MVAYVASYLFGKRTHINDIYERKTNKTEQYWTNPDVPGTKLATQPVYVLTAARTFSGAEEFAYDLQTTRRATIVGEVTGGGAHPTDGKRLDDHFVILFNGSDEQIAFTLPDADYGERWTTEIDTAAQEVDDSVFGPGDQVTAQARSVVVLRCPHEVEVGAPAGGSVVRR